MTITTNVEQVKLHIMTEQQYDDSAKSDSELYVITDATAMPMDDELSLSSENPVKNNVIKERFDEVQTELDDKLNKSVVWNKLNKAYGWTYRHLNGEGNAYLIYYTSNGAAYSDAISAQSIIEDMSSSIIPYNGKYVCFNNQLYYVQWNGENNILVPTLTPIGNNNCSCFATFNQNWNSGYLAIIDNNLYCNGYLKDSGGWTFITAPDLSNSNYSFGIKNDSLYFINNSGDNIVLKDDSGTWTYVTGYSSSLSCFGFGIKDNKLYSINTNGVYKISDDTGWSKICGYASNIDSFGLGIKNGALYSLTKDEVILIDNTETWIKICGYETSGFALTQSGKLYKLTSKYNIAQIGTDNTWTDISGLGIESLGIKNGDVYINLSDPHQLTNFGNITNVFGKLRNESYDNQFTGIFWTGSVTEDVHSIYTIAAPSIDFDTYSNVNLTKYGTITSISSSPYVVTDEHYTYNRDSSIDGVFTGISPDSSKQLMSMNDFLKCFTE